MQDPHSFLPTEQKQAIFQEPASGRSRELLKRMARRNRFQTPGLIRHVMARGNGRMEIFLDDEDYRRFIYLLANTCEEYDISCLGYCVMPNHYHAAIRPNLPNLSKAMQQLNGSYAQWWNKQHDRVGHVFQGRFKDQIVQREGYFLTLCRYIALNPVRARLAQEPGDWQWGSYRQLVGVAPCAPFLAAESVLAQFGEDSADVLRARFAEYVIGSGDPSELTIVDRIRSTELILGDKLFKDSVRSEAAVLHTPQQVRRRAEAAFV